MHKGRLSACLAGVVGDEEGDKEPEYAPMTQINRVSNVPTKPARIATKELVGIWRSRGFEIPRNRLAVLCGDGRDWRAEKWTGTIASSNKMPNSLCPLLAK